MDIIKSDMNEKKEVSDIIGKKKFSWDSIKEYLKTKKGKKAVVISLIGFIILIATIYAVYNRYFRSDGGFSALKEKILPGVSYDNKDDVKQVISKLDGQLHPEDVANRHPLAVVVENHPDARPQTGLDQASIIYEAIAEGGITRFLAIFGPNAPEKVGPVRSARTFFLDWALEYDAFFAHVGGSSEALALIPKIGIKDLNQFRYGEKAFWREPQVGKATEHTMYTDTNKLYEIAKENGWDIDKANYTGLEFKDDLAKDQRLLNQQSITVDFSSLSYKVHWRYDPETNLYVRSLAESAHKDALSGEQLKAKNVILEEVDRSLNTNNGEKSTWNMTTVGSGKAKVFLDGKTIEATWKKSNRNARTLFFDLEGKQIKFNPGVFWYEIVPPETPISIE